MELWTATTDISALTDWYHDLGMWGVVLSALLMVTCALTVLPAEASAIANGMVYGAFWGAVLTWASALLGANIAFGLSRVLGPKYVAKLVTPDAMDKLHAWTHNNGAWVLLAARCIPVIPFFALNYAAGLSGMRWGTYNLITAIGILPAILLLTVMGERALHMHWSAWIAVALALLVASGMLKVLLNSSANNRQEKTTEGSFGAAASVSFFATSEDRFKQQ